MTEPITCKKCGGWGNLCLCPKDPGRTWTSGGTGALVCYVCLLPLNPTTENTYTRQDDGARCHSDCLIRLAESHGHHDKAVEIQQRDLVSRFQKSEFL